MNQSPSSVESNQNLDPNLDKAQNTHSAEPQASYVKLAMRNMVRKGRTSLKHFFLTTVVFLSLLVGLAYLTR
jgi:hypothetical protein